MVRGVSRRDSDPTDSSAYASLGASTTGWSALSYDGLYSEVPLADFQYEISFGRTGSTLSETNSVFIRANPQPFYGSLKRWDNGYFFQVTRDGRASVWRVSRQTQTALLGWSLPIRDPFDNAVVIDSTTGACITLRVWTTGGGQSLHFAIKREGTTRFVEVLGVTDTTFAAGQFGVGGLRSNAALADSFYVYRAQVGTVGSFKSAEQIVQLTERQRRETEEATRHPQGTLAQVPPLEAVTAGGVQ